MSLQRSNLVSLYIDYIHEPYEVTWEVYKGTVQYNFHTLR
jgi:hypothetical protein